MLSNMTPFGGRLVTEVIGCKAENPTSLPDSAPSRVQYYPTQYGYDPENAPHKFIRMRLNNGIVPLATIKGGMVSHKFSTTCPGRRINANTRAFLLSARIAGQMPCVGWAAFWKVRQMLMRSAITSMPGECPPSSTTLAGSQPWASMVQLSQHRANYFVVNAALGTTRSLILRMERIMMELFLHKCVDRESDVGFGLYIRPSRWVS